jgi:hypothetical protein
VIIKYPTIKYYVYNRLIDYYLYLLYFAYYNNFNCNYVTNYTDKTLIDEIIKNYNNINKNQQTCLYNKLLFKYNNLFCYTSHRIIIINKITKSNRYSFNFKEKFYEFITSSFNTFDCFYNIIKQTIQIQYYKFEYDPNKQTTKEIFNDYIKLLENMSGADNYILLNKLEILHSRYDHNNCSYYKFINEFKYIPLSRLKNNIEWLNINKKIWKKIYSNIEVDLIIIIIILMIFNQLID